MNKNLSIQGLRGIAALIVFFSHALCFPNSDVIIKLKDSPLHLFFDGQIAVMIFIAISGFFYYKTSGPSLKTYMGGVRNKIIRILPPYIVVMIVAFLLCNLQIGYMPVYFTEWGNSFWNEHVSVVELIKQLTVLYPHDSHLINPPTWYVSMEVRLFLIIPIIVMFCNTKYTRWYFMLPLVSLVFLGGENFYGVCIIGCIARVAYNYLKKKVNTAKRLYKVLSALLLILSILILNIKNEITINPSVAFGMQSICAAIIVLLVFLNNYKALSNKVLVWFGNISYEFYLIHFVVLLMFRSLYYNFASYILVSLIVSIILSKMLNYGISLIFAKK